MWYQRESSMGSLLTQLPLTHLAPPLAALGYRQGSPIASISIKYLSNLPILENFYFRISLGRDKNKWGK